MSRHPSLKVSSLGAQRRSVMKRTERLEILKIDLRWKEGMDVTGLPKTKSE